MITSRGILQRMNCANQFFFAGFSVKIAKKAVIFTEMHIKRKIAQQARMNPKFYLRLSVATAHRIICIFLCILDSYFSCIFLCILDSYFSLAETINLSDIRISLLPSECAAM